MFVTSGIRLLTRTSPTGLDPHGSSGSAVAPAGGQGQPGEPGEPGDPANVGAPGNITAVTMETEGRGCVNLRLLPLLLL